MMDADSKPLNLITFLLARRSGTLYRTNSWIRRVVLIALGSFLRQSSLAFTSVTSALEVFLNGMRYINPRFTCLLTYLLTMSSSLVVRFSIFIY